MEEKNKSTCPVPEGILLVIGGKEDKDGQKDDKQHPQTYEKEEVLKTFLGLIQKENPVIYIVTSGSSEGEEMFEEYHKTLTDYQPMELGHLHHESRDSIIKDNDLPDKVDKADAFFFTGGDQLKLTSLYGGTTFLEKLKNKYIDEKIVIAGTSAGAMAMSTPMIYAGNDEKQQIAGEIKITTGLEFLKDVCIDTHFIDRSRFIRLAQVISTNPTCIGIGIEEDSAIIVRNGKNVEVIGSGLITIIEGNEMSHADMSSFNENMLVSIRDLKVHLISKGDKYDIEVLNPPHM
jgi:cyanophycinase